MVCDSFSSDSSTEGATAASTGREVANASARIRASSLADKPIGTEIEDMSEGGGGGSRQSHGSGQPVRVAGRVKAGTGPGSLSATRTKPLPRIRVRGYEGIDRARSLERYFRLEIYHIFSDCSASPMPFLETVSHCPYYLALLISRTWHDEAAVGVVRRLEHSQKEMVLRER